MKKLIWFGGVMLTWVVGLCVAKADAPPAAIMLQYKGAVQQRAEAGKPWTAVTVTNTVFDVGAEIQTAEKSEAVLKVGGMSILTLRELTLVRIRNVAGETSAVELDRGRVLNDVKRKSDKSTFTVKTPAAVAGVRGTMFIIETDEQQTTHVTVGDGSVAVTGTLEGSRTVVVEKGFTVRVVMNQPPEDPRKAELKQIQEMEGFKKSIEPLSGLGLGLGRVGAQMAEENFRQIQEAETLVQQLSTSRKADEKIAQDLKALAAAFRLCVEHTGYVPRTDDGQFNEKVSVLQSMLVEGKTVDGDEITGWRGPYVEGNLLDPYGRYYKVRYAENRSGDGRFEIYSLGRDPVVKTDDPIPQMLRLDSLTGPGGQLPAKPTR